MFLYVLFFYDEITSDTDTIMFYVCVQLAIDDALQFYLLCFEILRCYCTLLLPYFLCIALCKNCVGTFYVIVTYHIIQICIKINVSVKPTYLRYTLWVIKFTNFAHNPIILWQSNTEFGHSNAAKLIRICAISHTNNIIYSSLICRLLHISASIKCCSTRKIMLIFEKSVWVCRWKI